MTRQIPIRSPHKGRPKSTGIRWPARPVRGPDFRYYVCPFCDEIRGAQGRHKHEPACKRRLGITEDS